ncbi:ral guanine nucleotide dissociation stimulator-like isoform X8 [Diceros bicornis minor]|uniref:ral guanine nucleotide dissociation stimulator-like isoform X8 n=1 Tax=Diceros bicornis minor TaxID=77932 RepID=UPI0026F27A67|nr:ral guanine nucleotide dissociation stimulator-like isoform X8 [Diceros bicornis minor]
MFCCCIRTFGGAGLKKAQKENLFRHCRRWLSPHPRYLWASGRRQRKVTLPGSELSCRDPLSLARCELLEATEAEPEAPAAELQPAAEAGQWTVVEVELAPAPSIPPPLALEPASPPSAVLELEQGPTSAAAGVGAAELESPGPSLLVGSPSPPVVIKEGEKKPNLTAFPPKLVAEQLTVMDARVEMDTNRTCCTEWLCRLHEVEETESCVGPGPSVGEGNSLCAARSLVAQPAAQEAQQPQHLLET